MDLVWTTLIILTLLFPGFAFLIGFFSRERVSRETVWESPLIPLLVSLSFSLCYHGFYYITVDQIFHHFSLPTIQTRILLAALGSEKPDDPNTGLLADSISQYRTLIFLYLLIGLLIGSVIGRKFSGWVIGGKETWFWKNLARHFLPRHIWIADLVRDYPKQSTAWAYVLTSTQFDHKIVMYHGTVRDFFANNDGTLSYIVLSPASRFFMDLSDDVVAISDHAKRKQILSEINNPLSSSGTMLCHNLVIEGKDILNVVFEKMILPDSGSPSKDIEQLGKLAQTILERLVERAVATQRQSNRKISKR